jgi:hypothetical protein
MSTQLLLEEKHVLLKNELGEKLRKKHALELEITKQFEELKRLETSLEKQNHMASDRSILMHDAAHIFISRSSGEHSK